MNNYSVEDGLSQSYVNQTVQDDYGFLWVATEYGLNRFDGYQFQQIEGPDGAFKNDGIVQMHKLKDGRLLVSTYYTGAYFINPITLDVNQFYDGKLIDSKSELLTVEFAMEFENQLWLAIGRYLVVYDLVNGGFEKKFLLSQEQDLIRTLFHKDGYIYIGSSNGLYVYQIETGGASLIKHKPSNIKNTIDNNNVKYLSWDHRFGLLVGTVEGLYSLNFKSAINEPELLIENLNIWGVVRNANTFYIASEQGLYLYLPHTSQLKKIVEYSARHPLVSNNAVKDIYQDKSGLLWLASESKGVYYWDPKVLNFSSISKLSGYNLSNSSVHDFIEIEKDILWIATENGLNKLDRITKETKHYFVNDNPKNKWGKHFIYRLVPLDNRRIWLFHSEGVSLFDTETESIIPTNLSDKTNKSFSELYPFGLHPINESQFIFLSYKGHYLLDTEKDEIKSLTNLDKHFDPELSATFMKGFTRKNEVLYSVGGALYSYNFIEDSFDLIHKLANYQIHDFKYVSDWAEDSQGNIWLAYNSYGIVAIDRSYQVKHELTLAEGLPDNRVFSVTSSRDGKMWFSSQSGLYKVDSKTAQIGHFTNEQGLLSDEVYFANNQLSFGDVAFTSPAGIIYFNTDDIEDNTAPMPVKLLDVEVKSSNSIYLPKDMHIPISLDHDDFGLVFRFSNFDFSHQKQTKYKVLLSGASNILYDNYTKNEIEFTRLLPGDYIFSAAAYSAIDGTLGEAKTIKFKVKYNPWLSPYAIAVYIFSFLACFVLLYVRRVNQQRILQKAHRESLQSKQRASLALEATKSGIWVYNSQNQNLYQDRIVDELGYDKSRPNTLFAHLDLIHPDDKVRLDRQWRAFSSGDVALWDVTYRMKAKNGQWVWFRDLGQRSKETKDINAPVYTGTYTNINDSKNQELMTQLYGEALRKMNEWLLILDKNFELVASNEAFNKRFAQNKEVNQSTLLSLFDEQKRSYFLNKLSHLSVGEHLRIEEKFEFEGKILPVMLSISAIGEQSVSNYVLIATDLTQQKEVEDKLTVMANYDHLTNLANRSLIKDRIDQAIIHADNKVVALLFIDLDRFKQVNDALGHRIGDKLLVEVAEKMQEIIGPSHSVGRQSGDEFIVLIDNVNSPEAVSHYAHRLNQALSTPFTIDGNSVSISSSIGIAFYPFDAQNTEDLIQNADIAMIHAKKNGRNCYRFYTEELNTDVKQRLNLESALVCAVQSDSLTNYYQPIVNTQTQKIVGVELLLRWFNNGDMISPGVFIPLAEQIGQIVPITELAFNKALVELAPWLNIDKSHYLSINLSALHIGQPTLVESFVSILDKHNISTSQIRLELTEGILIEDTVNAIEQLDKLKHAGFKLFLDDFGTGYSSLTYINQFPIDVIKIDQSFIRQMNDSRTNQAIVQTIADLAKNLGTYCVAEGVEELSQVSVLKRLGCTNLQGFYFAKPMPVVDFLSDELQSNIYRKLNACKHA